MATLFVDKIDPQSGTSLEIGSSGDTITIPSGATITNNGTQTGFGGVNTPTFMVKLSSNQSVPTTSFTKIQFNSELFDTDGVYDNATNYRFTTGVAGKFYIFSEIYMNSLTDGKSLRVDIFKNGTSYSFGRTDSAKTGSSVSTGLSIIDNASSTDYYEIFVYHDEGSNLNVRGGSELTSYFGAYKIIE